MKRRRAEVFPANFHSRSRIDLELSRVNWRTQAGVVLPRVCIGIGASEEIRLKRWENEDSRGECTFLSSVSLRLSSGKGLDWNDRETRQGNRLPLDCRDALWEDSSRCVPAGQGQKAVSGSDGVTELQECPPSTYCGDLELFRAE